MRSLLCAAGAAGLLLLSAAAPPATAAAETSAAGTFAAGTFAAGTFAAGTSAAGTSAALTSAPETDGFTIKDPRITESSGLAASRAHPGVYWTHNDSDDGPYVYAVDSRTGRTVATVTLRGIGTPRDVEAVSVGPDGYVYVGDIGDNRGGTWSHVWIYRFREPARLRDQALPAAQFTVTYDDGPRDAESLMVHPVTGRVYIASKKQSGGALYEGPQRLSTSGGNVFRRVADVDLWATDGAFSPDGSRLVLRGYFGARMYRWHNGRPKDIGSVGVPFQRQGESVSFTPDGRTLMFGSEGASSEVQPVGLSGNQIPDGAAKGGATGSSGSTGQPGSSGPSSSPGSNAGKGGGSWAGTGPTGNVLRGAAVLGVAALLILGLRRLLRRR
ncbi:esterase-like activity of phytase family protein [Streptomyces sp. MST-110588]|uniref:esterase-like activity of phytase family protein n=1 Tax=Streptomyces sp. MST-110588 TaxID=2833628 RepID=UPI001F5C6A1F|nr:esterase-like activity of phytase family protein [Streptomyces sp. MST-110588]UNO40399.1 hypothetical protein KGS77_13460 [Streptomyces sp. MST-110588]